jgi:hypothetical protein
MTGCEHSETGTGFGEATLRNGRVPEHPIQCVRLCAASRGGFLDLRSRCSRSRTQPPRRPAGAYLPPSCRNTTSHASPDALGDVGDLRRTKRVESSLEHVDTWRHPMTRSEIYRPYALTLGIEEGFCHREMVGRYLATALVLSSQPERHGWYTRSCSVFGIAGDLIDCVSTSKRSLSRCREWWEGEHCEVRRVDWRYRVVPAPGTWSNWEWRGL